MIIQYYRGAVNGEGGFPLASSTLYGRYVKLQVFSIVLPNFTVPAKPVEVSEHKNQPALSKASIKAQTKLDGLVNKAEYFEKVLEKKEEELSKASTIAKNHSWNVQDLEEKLLAAQLQIDSLPKPETATSAASQVVRKENVVRLKEDLEDARELLLQAQDEEEIASGAYNKAQKDVETNKRAQEKQQDILHKNKLLMLKDFEATKNYQEIFRYDCDGRILAIQAHEFIDDGIYNGAPYLLEKEGRIITLVNPTAEDLVIDQGATLQISLLIGA